MDRICPSIKAASCATLPPVEPLACKTGSCTNGLVLSSGSRLRGMPGVAQGNFENLNRQSHVGARTAH